MRLRLCCSEGTAACADAREIVGCALACAALPFWMGGH